MLLKNAEQNLADSSSLKIVYGLGHHTDLSGCESFFVLKGKVTHQQIKGCGGSETKWLKH